MSDLENDLSDSEDEENIPPNNQDIDYRMMVTNLFILISIVLIALIVGLIIYLIPYFSQ